MHLLCKLQVSACHTYNVTLVFPSWSKEANMCFKPLPGGGIMASGTISSMNTGEYVTIAGLCVQLLFFSFFVITSAIFHIRIRQQPTPKVTQLDQEGSRSTTHRTWESVLWGLYIACALILVRSIFRLIEYAQGNDGYLISHEAFMYVFDAMLMFFAMVALNVSHPSVILAGRTKRGSMESIGSDSQAQLHHML